MPATNPVQAVADVMRTHLWSHAARSCSCGWEQKRKGAPFLRQWTEHVAEAAVVAARPAIAAEALRDLHAEMSKWEGYDTRDIGWAFLATLMLEHIEDRADDLEAGR